MTDRTKHSHRAHSSVTARPLGPQGSMQRKNKRHGGLRVVVDSAFGVIFVLLMASALREEVAHEWLGIAAFVLFVVHQVLNGSWWTHLFKGRYTALRGVQTFINVGLLLCLVGQVASSLILSEYACGFLPAFPGASWARVAHLACSYWGFLLVCIHAGLHVQPLARKLFARAGERSAAQAVSLWLTRLVFVALAVFGVWSFVQLDLVSYLSLQVQFVFVDTTVALWYPFAQYGAVGVLVGGIAHYAAKLLRPRRTSSEELTPNKGKRFVIQKGAQRFR